MIGGKGLLVTQLLGNLVTKALLCQPYGSGKYYVYCHASIHVVMKLMFFKIFLPHIMYLKMLHINTSETQT